MGLLNQLEKLAMFSPTVQVGMAQAAPPGFVFKAEGPLRPVVEQFQQPVALFFMQVIRFWARNPVFATRPVSTNWFLAQISVGFGARSLSVFQHTHPQTGLRFCAGAANLLAKPSTLAE